MQLRREECDVGQGYLVSPPLAPEAIEKLFGLATPRVNA
jgi:EAL domain-containing protein (putative c-di-GMP-specific phosphodiesterase class I)